MSKKQDELLIQEYVEIERQLSSLDEEWSYLRNQLKSHSQQYIDIVWHLFNYDEDEIKHNYESVYNTIQLMLTENRLQLQDVSGLTRIKDLKHPKLDLYKDVETFMENELMFDNVLYLKDENSYNSISSAHVVSDQSALDAYYSSYSDFNAYISSLDETQKNRLLIEFKYLKQVVTNLFNVIDSEYQELRGRIIHDISRVQPVYEQLLIYSN